MDWANPPARSYTGDTTRADRVHTIALAKCRFVVLAGDFAHLWREPGDGWQKPAPEFAVANAVRTNVCLSEALPGSEVSLLRAAQTDTKVLATR